MLIEKKKISGWGRFTSKNSKIYYPENILDLKLINKKKFITRGSGLSYGDSASYQSICSTLKLKKIINFDSYNGLIECESGVTFNELIQLIVKKNWFFNVTPGSSFVTIGGAVASDVHGKNHHKFGSFCDHVISIKLLCKNNKILNLTKKKNKKLFHATCGGMGLTGIILSVKFRLKKINNNFISSKTIKFNNLASLIKSINRNNSYEYNVAWIDFSNFKNINSILFLGSHSSQKKYQSDFKKKNKQIDLTFFKKIIFINNLTIKIFNKLYYFLTKEEEKKIDIFNYFYPLDKIKNWNYFYGNDGFVQYQFVITEKKIEKNLNKIIKIFKEFEIYPSLSVFKKLGNQNKNYISFPKKGFTLSLDFKNSKNLRKMIRKLDLIVLQNQGRIYLAKDILMNELFFKKTYPLYRKFYNILSSSKVNFQYASDQAKRLKILCKKF